jgi:hypothetical protein
VNDWRKLPIRERPYDAYRKPRYVVDGCDHNGVLCRCDVPYWLRESTPAEKAHEAAVGPEWVEIEEPRK